MINFTGNNDSDLLCYRPPICRSLGRSEKLSIVLKLYPLELNILGNRLSCLEVLPPCLGWLLWGWLFESLGLKI